MDSFDLTEELQAIADLSTYSFNNEVDVSSLDHSAIAQVLDPAVDALAHSSDSITDPAVFDAYQIGRAHV